MPNELGQVSTTWKVTVDRLISQGEFDYALKQLQLYKQQIPDDLDIRIKIAELLHKMRRTVEAKLEAEEADTVVQDNVDDQKRLIKIHLHLGSDHRAFSIARNVLRKDGGLFEFRWICVDYHLRKRELNHARGLLKEAEALSKIQVSDLTMISFYYRQVHRRYMLLLTHQKNDFRPMVSDMKMALISAQKATAMDSRYAPAQLAVAEAAKGLGDSRLAVRSLRTFSEPGDHIDAEQRMQAAELLDRCGEANLAMAIARSAAHAPRWNLSNRVRYAHLMFGHGFPDEAQKVLGDIELQRITSKITLYNILELYLKFELRAEMLATCDRILELFPYDDVATRNMRLIKMTGSKPTANVAVNTPPLKLSEKSSGWIARLFSKPR